MRVLYHHRTLADGAEGVHIEAMVEALRSLGHDVRVMGVVPQPGRQPGAGRSIASWLRSATAPALFEIASLALNVPDYWKAAWAIRRFKPDVLYKRHARFDVGTLLAARRRGIPALLEVNCLFTQPPYADFEPHVFGRLAKRLEAASLSLASRVLAVSSPLARMASTLSATPALVVPNGADDRRFDPAAASPARVREHWGLGGRFVVGWVGVLREWHGLELLLDAMNGLPGATLLVVGDGPSRAAFMDRTKDAGLSDRVIVTGRVSHAEMPDYLAAFDVAVVPDERTGVASPMKLLEYMAMGRAVVAPALDNIRDIVTDRTNGLLFEQGNAVDLRERLRELSADESLRVALGAQARRTVVEGRTWRAIAQQILSLVRP